MAKRQSEKPLLSASLVNLAIKAIHDFDKAGKKAQDTMDNVSKHVLLIAQAAEKESNANKESIFVEMCRQAEVVFKEEHEKDGKVPPIQKLLPWWPVVKSQVRAGLKAGLKVRDFKTVYELQQKTPVKERAARTTDGTKENGKEGDDTGKVTLPNDDEGKAVNTNLKRVHDALKEMVTRHMSLKSAGEILAKAAEALEEIVSVTNAAPVDDDAEPAEKVA